MANLGRYCKAYYLKEIRNFPGLGKPDPMTAQEGQAQAAGSAPGSVDLPDDAIVYLHDDFSVTSGIARDEEVIFRSDAPAWESYCQEALKFEVPVWRSEDGMKPEPASQP